MVWAIKDKLHNCASRCTHRPELQHTNCLIPKTFREECAAPAGDHGVEDVVVTAITTVKDRIDAIIELQN